jgi:hypothetical protein
MALLCFLVAILIMKPILETIPEPCPCKGEERFLDFPFCKEQLNGVRPTCGYTLAYGENLSPPPKRNKSFAFLSFGVYIITKIKRYKQFLLKRTRIDFLKIY